MRRLIQLYNHPFRLLLYLEWILLGITILTAFPIAQAPPPPIPLPHPPAALVPQSSLLTLLSTIFFGLMGLRLPKTRLWSKILYTGFGFGLIVLAVIGGTRGFRVFPSLILILVIRSCLIFGLTGRLIITGIAFLSFILIWFLPARDILFVRTPVPAAHCSAPIPVPGAKIVPVPPPKVWIFKRAISADQFILNIALNAALLFGLVLVFVLLLINALLAERQSRQQLAIANEQLRQYARRIEDQATLQERNRIAREIHDSLGHSLTAQSIQLENALMFLQSNVDKSQMFLQDAKRLGKDALNEVRQSIATLRSNPLQEQSLEEAIASLVKDFRRTTGIEPDYKINFSFTTPNSKNKLVLPFPIEINTAIYRIAKEALTNIYKHSAATKVKIRLLSNAEAVYLVVEDNGKGFQLDQVTTGFGLQGMRERTVALGGRFKITSQPGTGCRIKASIPLPTVYP